MRRPALAIGLLLAAIVSNAAHAAPRDTDRKAVLIVAVPGLSAEDIQSLSLPERSAVDRLCRAGSVGWMNSRTACDRDHPGDATASGFLTIGAGTRAVATAPARGSRLPALSSYTLPDLDALRRRNETLNHPVSIGALGEVCRSAGLRLVVIGSDGEGQAIGSGILLAMDRNGTVDCVDPSLTVDLWAPYACRTNVDRFTAADGALTVWVFGDIARAERYASLCTPAMARRHRSTALQRLDAVIGEDMLPWVSQRPRHRLAILVAPMSSASLDAGDRLAPVAMFGDGFPPGILSSPTTRRPGLISNTDVVPTVARFLGAPVPSAVVGRPARNRPVGPISPAAWRQWYADWRAVSALQEHLGTMTGIRIAVLAALLILMLAVSHRSVPPAMRRRAYILAVSLGAASTATLAVHALSGLPSPMPVAAAALAMLGVCIAGATLAGRGEGFRRRLAFGACALFAACMLCGLILWPPLVHNSWLGYSVMEGARYYGIGNETAGALLAAAVVLIRPLLTPDRALAAALFLAGWSVIIGSPSAGANLGAALAVAIAAAAATGIAYPSRQRKLRIIAAALLVTAIVVIVIVKLDTGADATHMGTALSQRSSILAIALRKVTLNLHLLLNSLWTPCLILGAALLSFMMRRTAEPARYEGLKLLGIGALAMLLLNDSGVVAAGMALSVGLPALLLISPTQATESGEAERVAHNKNG
jgi:hypothetical protein